MADRFPGSVITTYRDLLDQCQHAAFENAFADPGIFVKKVIKGRNYWYFRATGAEKPNHDHYVGAETPELLERMRRHKTLRHDEKQRRTLVGMLRRAGLPTPTPEVGNVLQAFARQGVFRHRVCLVGTYAFNAYSGLIGARFKSSSLGTQDIDVAQFKGISIAVAEDETINISDILKSLDPSFRPVSKPLYEAKPIAFLNDAKTKVEILSPNRGPDTDEPIHLPSIGTFAHAFRFLDFLIYEPVPALVLHGDGVVVTVPSPERYAIHKLIVADRRTSDKDKVEKDLAQSSQLIDALWAYQKDDVLFALREAINRGDAWREAITRSLQKIEINETNAEALTEAMKL